ncbi:hypothetical protein LX14_001511 [Williamsia deligens]|nr:hypothetical protein [Williamsia deligens]
MRPVTIAIRPFELDRFEALPRHTRRCVFWEVDPAANPDPGSGRVIDTEFDKEAWVSMVMLDWGRCAQTAVDTRTDRIVGTAFYAPPGRVPRARLFPTSPVSPDAVLLTSIRVEAGRPGTAQALIDAVLGDLIRRGVRAVEAFGIVRSSAVGDADPTSGLRDNAVPGGLCAGCMVDAHFLADAGFELVAAHHRFPRYRLELDEGLGWKNAVESALDNLVIMATIDVTGRERTRVATPVG